MGRIPICETLGPMRSMCYFRTCLYTYAAICGMSVAQLVCPFEMSPPRAVGRGHLLAIAFLCSFFLFDNHKNRATPYFVGVDRIRGSDDLSCKSKPNCVEQTARK